MAGYRHTPAHHLTQVGQHDLALPLLAANLSIGGHSGNGYVWLMHAAAVWQVTRDRPRVSDCYVTLARMMAETSLAIFKRLRRFAT